jgi:hypothetical protein
MANLLYFIPNVRRLHKPELAAAGLVLASESVSHVPLDRDGPGGAGGLLCSLVPQAAGGRQAEFGYFPARQAWAAVNGGRYWIGFDKSDPPRPIDLQRRELIAGHPVKLNDGHEWHIPAARLFPQGSAFPAVLRLGPDDRLVTEVVPEYRGLVGQVERLWPVFIGEAGATDVGLTDEQIWSLCVDALRANYCVGPREVSVLGLLTTRCWYEVLAALVDAPTVRAWLADKKNGLAIRPFPEMGAGADA